MSSALLLHNNATNIYVYRLTLYIVEDGDDKKKCFVKKNLYKFFGHVTKK